MSGSACLYFQQLRGSQADIYDFKPCLHYKLRLVKDKESDPVSKEEQNPQIINKNKKLIDDILKLIP